MANIGDELSALLGQLQTQKQQVDGILNRSPEAASRSPVGSATREVRAAGDITRSELMSPPSLGAARSPGVPMSALSADSVQKHKSSVLNVPSIRLANGARFDMEDLYDMLPTLEWDKLFKQVEIAAQEKGKYPRQTSQLNSMEDELALLKNEVSSADMQAQDAQTREVKLHAEIRDRDERLQKVAGSTLLACLELQNSLERVGALHMSGQKVQGPSGAMVQLRMQVEHECLKELDGCRSKVKHLEIAASSVSDVAFDLAPPLPPSAGFGSIGAQDPLKEVSGERLTPSHLPPGSGW